MAELVLDAGAHRVGAAQRRVGETVLERDNARGAELAAAGIAIDRGEDRSRADVLPVARHAADHRAAKQIVTVGDQCCR